MANQVIRQASKCANFLSQKVNIFKIKSNKKPAWEKIYPKLLIY